MGDIIILGDFNARTKDLQVPLYDRSSDSNCTSELDPTTMGLQHTSEDVLGPLSVYGRHLFQLCESSGLLILNGLSFLPGSDLFTCWPHCGGASVVDYVISSYSFISSISRFTISRLPFADHALLSISVCVSPHPSPPLLCQDSSISLPTRFNFPEGDGELFLCHLRRFLSPASFDESLAASDMFESLASAIWDSALLSIPHRSPSSSRAKRRNTCPMNKWFDTDCKAFHRFVRIAFEVQSPAFSHLRLEYLRFLRRKKRSFASTQCSTLCSTFIQNPQIFWRTLFPRCSPPSSILNYRSLTSHICTLYDIPGSHRSIPLHLLTAACSPILVLWRPSDL